MLLEFHISFTDKYYSKKPQILLMRDFLLVSCQKPFSIAQD